jgi:hypothetical protein
MQLKEQNMFKIVKLLYVMFILFFIFLISTNVNGKPFFFSFQILFLTSYTICYSNFITFLFSLFKLQLVIDVIHIDKHCYHPKEPRCIKTRCFCVDLNFWVDVENTMML